VVTIARLGDPSTPARITRPRSASRKKIVGVPLAAGGDVEPPAPEVASVPPAPALVAPAVVLAPPAPVVPPAPMVDVPPLLGAEGVPAALL
jgi:hypothetical protein